MKIYYGGLLSVATLLSLILGLILGPVFALAQTTPAPTPTQTPTTPAPAATDSTDPIAAKEAVLRAQLDEVLKEIDAQQTILNAEQTKASSFARDIAILNAQIKQAQLTIKAHEIAIQGLGKDITQKTATINDLSAKIDKNKESLSALLRKTAMADTRTLPEIMLNDGNLSDFFTEVNEYNALQQAVKSSSDDIRTDKSATEVQKDGLDKQRIKETDEKISVEDEQHKIQLAENQKQQLLSLSVAQQRNYEGIIKDRQAQAAAIRSALFGLRDTAAIPFGKALEYANTASTKTGVRPAFLLAILTQESNLGKNTGSCYLKDVSTGAGVGANTGTPIAKVMSPTRDVPVFIAMMQAVGRDPFNTKVSCPQSIGWGGAMGPAQFIPSTWQLLQSQIGVLVGKTVPDPWDPQDAFMASALYLSNLGASAGGFTAERNAACKYYSGKACSAGTGASYGDSVIAKAQTIQDTMIAPLQGL